MEYESAMGHTFGQTQTHGPASRHFVKQIDILGDFCLDESGLAASMINYFQEQNDFVK